MPIMSKLNGSSADSGLVPVMSRKETALQGVELGSIDMNPSDRFLPADSTEQAKRRVMRHTCIAPGLAQATRLRRLDETVSSYNCFFYAAVS